MIKKPPFDPFASMDHSLNKKVIKRGTMLLHQGDQSKEAFLVVSGCLRSYVTNKAGKEYIMQFAPEGWFISDMNGFRNSVNSSVSIQAIEDSKVMVLTRDMLKQVKDHPKEMLVKQIQTFQNNIIALNRRLLHLLSATAEERYLDFIDTYPSLAVRLPLKMIASYLGITPECLSRIRKDLAGR